MTIAMSPGARAAVYHRASTTDQDVEVARHELHTAAKVRGLTVVLDVREHGSGARCDRAGLQRVLKAAQRGEVDVVLVYKLDRWGRSVVDVLHNVRVLNDAGVDFVCVTQGLCIKAGGDAVSNLILGVLASVAAFELDLIRSRTRTGLEKAKRAGKRLGRPRKGNKPDPAQVIAMRVAGASWAQVAVKLGCTVASARRACQNGTPNPPLQVCETASAG